MTLKVWAILTSPTLLEPFPLILFTCALFTLNRSSHDARAAATDMVPAYFELSWSILSTIGLFLTVIGFWAILITRVSPLHLVPIIVSIACAIANGLCYYAFYTDYPTRQRVVASVFADIFWLVGAPYEPSIRDASY